MEDAFSVPFIKQTLFYKRNYCSIVVIAVEVNADHAIKHIRLMSQWSRYVKNNCTFNKHNSC